MPCLRTLGSGLALAVEGFVAAEGLTEDLALGEGLTEATLFFFLLLLLRLDISSRLKSSKDILIPLAINQEWQTCVNALLSDPSFIMSESG